VPVAPSCEPLAGSRRIFSRLTVAAAQSLSSVAMARRREGEILAQKVFMCPISLIEALKAEARKTGKSESEITREALRRKLAARRPGM